MVRRCHVLGLNRSTDNIFGALYTIYGALAAASTITNQASRMLKLKQSLLPCLSFPPPPLPPPPLAHHPWQAFAAALQKVHMNLTELNATGGCEPDDLLAASLTFPHSIFHSPRFRSPGPHKHTHTRSSKVILPLIAPAPPPPFPPHTQDCF